VDDVEALEVQGCHEIEDGDRLNCDGVVRGEKATAGKQTSRNVDKIFCKVDMCSAE